MNRPVRTAVVVALVCVGLVAAAAAAADKAKNLLKEPNKPESWKFEQHEKGKGTQTADGDAILWDVTEVDGENWHVQVFMHDVEFKEGKEYTFTYKAKGDP